MPRQLIVLCAALFFIAVLPRPVVAETFDLRGWDAIEKRAAGNDKRAAGLRDGYLAGVRDSLRFYTKVSNTFPICWPTDHKLDAALVGSTVAAVRRQFPEMANADDNFAYLIVLALYNVYPCR